MILEIIFKKLLNLSNFFWRGGHDMVIISITLIIPIIANKHIMEVMHIMLIILWIQVLIDLSLADHVWQNKRTAIAQEVDWLGAQFRSAMRAGWLSYFKDTYAALREEGAIGPSIGQGKMVVDDEGWVAASVPPPEIMRQDFHNEYSPETSFIFWK